jgi:hypothetical protein
MTHATFNRRIFSPDYRGGGRETTSLRPAVSTSWSQLPSLLISAVFSIGGLCVVLWMLSWNAG